MKVHTIRKTHALATIENEKQGPMVKAAINAAGRDSMLQVAILVAEVFADAQAVQNKWHDFAWRIIRLDTDGRTEFVKMVRRKNEELRKELEHAHAMDSRAARKTLNSATVQISRLNTIATAWNSGATRVGMAEFYDVPDPENIGFIRIYDYAKTFTAAKAGRKQDDLLTKLDKWLKAAAAQADDSVADAHVYNKVLELYTRLCWPSTDNPAVPAAPF